MDDPRCVDLDGFKTVVAEAGVEVIEPGWRRGKAPKVPRLSYRVASMATNVTGATLGELYMYDNVVSQADAIAAGLPRARRPEPPAAGPPKPLTVTTDQELTQARDTVARMVQEERLDAWLDDWASEENTTVAELLFDRGRVRDRPGDQEVLHRWMGHWEADRAKKQTQATDPPPIGGEDVKHLGQVRKQTPIAKSLPGPTGTAQQPRLRTANPETGPPHASSRGVGSADPKSGSGSEQEQEGTDEIAPHSRRRRNLAARRPKTPARQRYLARGQRRPQHDRQYGD